MSERTEDKPVTVFISDWTGAITNADAEDLPTGTMQQQINMHSVKQGVLQCRRGLREITFDG